MDENSETENSPLSTQSVIDNYLKEPTLSRKSDPLAYWKSNQDNLPHLTSVWHTVFVCCALCLCALCAYLL